MTIVPHTNNRSDQQIQTVGNSEKEKITLGGKQTTVEIKSAPPPKKARALYGDQAIAEDAIKNIADYILKKENHNYEEEELLALGVPPFTHEQCEKARELIKNDPFIFIVDNDVTRNPHTGRPATCKKVTISIHDREIIALLDKKKVDILKTSGIFEAEALYVSKLALVAIANHSSALRRRGKTCILV